MKTKKFWAFQISKTIIFEVEYYQLGNNRNPYFSTSANKFNQPKTDWNQCGQAQESLLPKNSIAYQFYRYWNDKHCQDLTQQEYDELIGDIEALKSVYNYIEIEQDENLYRTHISFYDLKELSKMKMPNSKNKPTRLKI